MTTTITRATDADLDAIGALFDAYRVFYGRASDPALARRFLAERQQRGESVLLVARIAGAAVGFTQLYPMFSSVSTARIWILNDLYVAPSARRAGVARELLCAAEVFAREDGAIRIELETGQDNANAQALYRDAGWQKQDATLRFVRPLDSA